MKGKGCTQNATRPVLNPQKDWEELKPLVLVRRAD